MIANYNDIEGCYIPDGHEKYDLLPKTRENNVEIIIWDNNLLSNIKKLTGMTDHETLPYCRYESITDFLKEMDDWVNKYPAYEKEIREYTDSVKKMNNKDLWAVVQYVGVSHWSFTNNKYYYVVMYKEDDSWVVGGIIDNEEYDAFVAWKPDEVDLLKDFNIVIDPSDNLPNEFAKLMKNR